MTKTISNGSALFLGAAHSSLAPIVSFSDKFLTAHSSWPIQSLRRHHKDPRDIEVQ